MAGQLQFGLYEHIVCCNPGEVREEIKDFIQVLTGHELKFLKKGRYASVFANKATGTVLKVGDANNNAGYLAYLKLARRHQDNPFFPEIHWVGHFHGGEENFFVVKMERLHSGENFVSKRMFLPSWWRVTQFIQACRLWPHYELPSFLGQQTPKSLMDFFHILKEEQGGNGGAYKWDINNDNLMIRDNGQLVVTDPWA